MSEVKLTEAAWRALRDMRSRPLPRQEINPGLVDRLVRDRFVEAVDLPSPYATRKGMVKHLQITDLGRSTWEAETHRGSQKR